MSPTCLLFPSPRLSIETKGTDHLLMGKPQIPVRLGGYRKYELLFETIQLFCSVQSLQLIWLQFVAEFVASLLPEGLPKGQIKNIKSFNVYQERNSLGVYACDFQAGGLYKY